MSASPLAEWDNSYVIVGSAAGGLTGLTFVVIARAADVKRVSLLGLRTFVTPTIVHFGAVLALSAYLSVPHQTVTSLCAGLGVGAVAGILYIAAITAAMRSVAKTYVPVHEDWIWNAVVPGLAYVGLLAMAVIGWHDLAFSLYGVATVSVVLLFTGIHNAWDVAVWNSIKNGSDPTSPPKP